MSFQQAEVPEDSDDDDPDEVFGFITMLNLTERKVTCWAIKQHANREDNVVKVETTCHLGPVDACESNVKKNVSLMSTAVPLLQETLKSKLFSFQTTAAIGQTNGSIVCRVVQKDSNLLVE